MTSSTGQKTLHRRLEWLYGHPLVFIGGLLIISIGLILANMYTVANVLTEESGKRYAEQYLNALEKFRSTYSSEIVARLQDHGIAISQDYRAHEGHIPFPATFSIILSQRISQDEININTNLYSDYPWPWRIDGGPRDEFEKTALEVFRANPGQSNYSRVARQDGIRILRYGKPVLMKESCVACHNSMDSSPKKDWDVGDVRGVHAVSMTLPVPTSVIIDRFSSTSLLMVGGTVFSLLLLAHFLRALRQSTQETEVANLALSKTNTAYSRFVPHEFLTLLKKERIIDVELGDHTQKEMTILFSDVREFTTISERLNPEENFSFINNYLSVMGPVVREHGGFVDKYIGDAIMALFSSPDDALEAALVMLRRLPDCGVDAVRLSDRLEIGIGLNTGHLMLGTVGEAGRMEGTVISDAVNIAARIEGLTKTFGVPLIISHSTLKRLKDPDKFKLRCIGHVTVKGKRESVTVYEVFNNDSPELAARKLAERDRFEEAVGLYESGEFAQARELFQQCLKAAPEDTLVRQYRERCERAVNAPPDKPVATFWQKVPFNVPTKAGADRRVYINCEFRKVETSECDGLVNAESAALIPAARVDLLRRVLTNAVIVRRRNERGEPIEEPFTDKIKEWLINQPYFAEAAATTYISAMTGAPAEPEPEPEAPSTYLHGSRHRA